MAVSGQLLSGRRNFVLSESANKLSTPRTENHQEDAKSPSKPSTARGKQGEQSESVKLGAVGSKVFGKTSPTL